MQNLNLRDEYDTQFLKKQTTKSGWFGKEMVDILIKESTKVSGYQQDITLAASHLINTLKTNSKIKNYFGTIHIELIESLVQERVGLPNNLEKMSFDELVRHGIINIRVSNQFHNCLFGGRHYYSGVGKKLLEIKGITKEQDNYFFEKISLLELLSLTKENGIDRARSIWGLGDKSIVELTEFFELIGKKPSDYIIFEN